MEKKSAKENSLWKKVRFMMIFHRRDVFSCRAACINEKNFKDKKEIDWFVRTNRIHNESFAQAVEGSDVDTAMGFSFSKRAFCAPG